MKQFLIATTIAAAILGIAGQAIVRWGHKDEVKRNSFALINAFARDGLKGATVSWPSDEQAYHFDAMAGYLSDASQRGTLSRSTARLLCELPARYVFICGSVPDDVRQDLRGLFTVEDAPQGVQLTRQPPPDEAWKYFGEGMPDIDPGQRRYRTDLTRLRALGAPTTDRTSPGSR